MWRNSENFSFKEYQKRCKSFNARLKQSYRFIQVNSQRILREQLRCSTDSIKAYEQESKPRQQINYYTSPHTLEKKHKFYCFTQNGIEKTCKNASVTKSNVALTEISEWPTEKNSVPEGQLSPGISTSYYQCSQNLLHSALYYYYLARCQAHTVTFGPS